MANINYENLVSAKMQELSQIGSEIRNTFMLGQDLKETCPDLIDLSLGNPDLEPPPIVKTYLKELLDVQDIGAHRYMDGAGLEDVRKFISNELSRTENVPITSKEVFLTVGAAGALQICMRAFLQHDDEVIIFKPYFPEYLSYTHHLGANPIVINSDDNHEPLLDEFENRITKKTKLIIINSPNNPSGVYYSSEYLEKFFKILLNKSKEFAAVIPVISDEPYARLLFVERQKSILEMYPHSFIVRSLSKDLGLAGERIGYFAWSQNAFPNSLNLMSVFRNAARVAGFVCAPRLQQRLIPHIFNAKVDINLYQERISQFLKILELSEVFCVKPKAGFFVFPKIDNGFSDQEFCRFLAQKGVLCVPGSAFGKPGYVRASLTQSLSNIIKAAEIFVQAYNEIKKLK